MGSWFCFGQYFGLCKASGKKRAPTPPWGVYIASLLKIHNPRVPVVAKGSRPSEGESNKHAGIRKWGGAGQGELCYCSLVFQNKSEERRGKVLELTGTPYTHIHTELARDQR